VALINYYQKEADIRLDLSGLEVKKKADRYVLTGSAPDEMNDFDNPDRIHLVNDELATGTGEMNLRLAPMSASVIEFTLEKTL
jgi:alpha-N-arabinofuranosidase